MNNLCVCVISTDQTNNSTAANASSTCWCTILLTEEFRRSPSTTVSETLFIGLFHDKNVSHPVYKGEIGQSLTSVVIFSLMRLISPIAGLKLLIDSLYKWGELSIFIISEWLIDLLITLVTFQAKCHFLDCFSFLDGRISLFIFFPVVFTMKTETLKSCNGLQAVCRWFN